MKQSSKIEKCHNNLQQRELTEIVQPVCNYQQNVDLVMYTSETVPTTPVYYLPALTASLSQQATVITCRKAVIKS